VRQILGLGQLFDPPIMTTPLIAAELGWSIAFHPRGP
jgi:hypothetical protein